MTGAVDRAAEWIGGAEALLVCAGAGMGVDSGLPDYRGDEGFWRAYPPYARLGLSFVDLADPGHFGADPELAWGFFGHRLELYRKTVPHRGFPLLRKWGEGKPGGSRVFTSNVDGQFQKAGWPAGHVGEVHGSIHHLQCFNRCTDRIWSAEHTEVEVDPETMRAHPPLPSCPDCGGLARPNILMFDDFGWLPHRSDGPLQALTEWRRAHRDLVVVELGAGQAVPTVRRYAELASAATGKLIRINPRESGVRHGRGISLPLTSLEALSQLESALIPAR